jgi:hypothetical protein
MDAFYGASSFKAVVPVIYAHCQTVMSLSYYPEMTEEAGKTGQAF